MNTPANDAPTTEPTRTPVNRSWVFLGHASADVAVAVVWAALIVAIVLFSGVVSQFAYVDF